MSLYDDSSELFQNYNNFSNETAQAFVDYVFSLVPGTGGIIHGDLEITGNLKVDMNFTLHGDVKDNTMSAIRSADFNNRDLFDNSGVSSIAWSNRTAADSLGHTAINWDTRNLYFSTGTDVSVDWDNALMYDTSFLAAVNWDTRILYQVDGLHQSIDYAIQLLYSNADNLTSIDWANRTLNDSSGIISVDYDSRVLFDENGDIPLTWKSTQALANLNAATPYVRLCKKTVDIKSVSATLLGSPVGNDFVITGITEILTAETAITVMNTRSIGSNGSGTANNLVASGAVGASVALNNVYNDTLIINSGFVPSNTSIYYKTSIAATGTSGSIEVSVWGYWR